MRVRLLLATVVVAAACGGSDNSLPTQPTHTTVDVYTVNFAFTDASISINTGDTVRWNFNTAPDGLGHNVRFDPRPAGTPNDIGSQASPASSGRVSRVFTTAGDFRYICDLHGSMTGEVVVK